MNNAESLDGQYFDVVIIGAGVAGAMTGLLSSRAGLRTLLVDRQRFPRHKVCGCCVNGRAVQILKQAGLESGLKDLAATTTSELAVRYGGRSLDVPMPVNAAVSRRVMDQWLVDEAVACGCLFADDVTASVEPLPCDAIVDHHAVSASVTAESSHERIIVLRPTGTVHHATHPEVTSRHSEASSARVFARVAVICDGLGHPSLHQLSSFGAVAEHGSRIGLGAVFPRAAVDDWIKPDQVLMAVAQHGYAGVVEIENQQLNLAAAVDPAHLNQTKSPLRSLEAIFHSAGVPLPAELCHASIKGTVPLTRSARRIAGHRLFLLGDATGYVEPFTGEGMAWALTAATAVVPLLITAVRDGWSANLGTRWQVVFRKIVGREQKICRLLSAALRQPWLLLPIMTTCRLFPSLTRHLVSQINRVPEALESL